MDKVNYNKWCTYLKVIPLLGSIIGLFWGVYEYRENAQREFKKPFLEEQLKTCKEVTSLVAEVARIKGNKTRAAQIDRLSILYFSKAALFLHGESLREFRSFIDLVSQCKDKDEINECLYLNMGGYQLNIARACRNELVKSWNQDVESLKAVIKEPVSW